MYSFARDAFKRFYDELEKNKWKSGTALWGVSCAAMDVPSAGGQQRLGVFPGRVALAAKHPRQLRHPLLSSQ